MKLGTFLIVGLGFFVAGCAEKEQAAEPAAPEPEGMAAESEELAPWETDDSWRSAEFIAYMHEKAEKLDEINFALADGDLAATKVPADWLATHETFEDVQGEWLPYQYAMRAEAEAVVAATDIATAKAAAERITARCQACHAAVGIATY